MVDLILIAGAPGSGKTTVAEHLQEGLGSVLVDPGPRRSDASEDEEQAAFESLVTTLRDHVRRGDENVIVTDLSDERVQEFPGLFADESILIATLVLRDDMELRRRVMLPERDSEFRDEEAAVAWNRAILDRPTLRGEKKIDNTARDPSKAVKRILTVVEGRGGKRSRRK